MKNERKAQRSQRQNEHGARRGQGWKNDKEKEKRRGANKRNILVQVRKKEAKEEEAGRAIQKERGANKGNMLV